MDLDGAKRMKRENDVSWIYLALAILCEVVATSAMAVSDGFRKLIPSGLGLVTFGISFVFLALALKTIPMGIAYAIWSAVGIVLVSLIGFGLLGQKLDAPALAGMGLIIAGVVVIQLFSTSGGH